MGKGERCNKYGFLRTVIRIVVSVALVLGLVPAAALAEAREEVLEVMTDEAGRSASELPVTGQSLPPQAEVELVGAEDSDRKTLEDDCQRSGAESDKRGSSLFAVESAKTSSDLADFLRGVTVEGAVEEDGVAHVVEGLEYDVRMAFGERPDLWFADGILALNLPACLAIAEGQPWLEGIEADGVDVTIEDGMLKLAWANACGSLHDRLRMLDVAEFDIVVRGTFLSGADGLSVGDVDLPVSVEAAGQSSPEGSDLGIDGIGGEFQDGQLPPDDSELDADDVTVVEEAPAEGRDTLEPSVVLDEGAAEEPQPEVQHEVAAASRREYVYADDQVRVVATLADPGAVPDDAELRVRRVSRGGAEAYLDAMNDATGGRPHTERNTLLYDVAFVLGDEEVEPEDGSVSVSFTFRRGQLSDGLGAAGPGDVEVTHIVEEGGELIPESVEASVSPRHGFATFDAESFSVYAFSYTVDFELGGLEYTLPGEGSVRLSSLFAALGIREDVGRVEGVEFSSPELVSVSRGLVGDDWVLTSLKPFRTDEELTVTMQSGLRYVIRVTDAQITIVAQPASITVAPGQNASFSVTATGTGLTYQWQTQLVGSGTWQSTTLPGNRTRTLSFAAQSAYNGRRYRCVVSDSGGLSITSAAATLTVGGPVITAPARATTVNAAEGQTVCLTVNATGEGLTYQWQTLLVGSSKWQNTNLPGGRTRTLCITARLEYSGRKYRCVVTDANGASAISPAITLMVVARPAITSQPISITRAPGQTATFSVTATGTGLTYQWQTQLVGSSSWQNTSLGGSGTRTLSFTAKSGYTGRKYRCVVTDSHGVSVTSAAATLTVCSPVMITSQPPSSISMTDGQATVIGVTATGTGLTYQWQTQLVGSGTWQNTSLEGNRTRALNIPGNLGYTGRKYRCKVTDGGGNTATSNAATLTVVAKPAITSHPAGITRAPGQNGSFSVTATGTGLTYQWQTLLAGNTTWQNTSLGGCRTRTLSFAANAAYTGRKYRCVVTDANGYPVTSREATLTVGAAPGITSHPASATRDTGQVATFSVTATGTGLTYQWQTQLVGSGTWQSTTLPGNRTRTLSFAAQSGYNGRKYRCVVTGSNGLSSTSNPATLTVVARPTIDSSPSSRKACAGQTVSFYVGASGTGLSYQWQTLLVGSGSWQNTSLGGCRTSQLSFAAQSAYSGRGYRCVVTDAQGVSVTSEPVTLTVASAQRISYGRRVVSVDTRFFRQRLSFVPQGTGTYVLESSGPDDTIAYLYDSGGSQLAYNDDGGTDRNFCLRYDLVGGRTYYYDVGYYYENTGDVAVSLSKEVTVGGSSAEVAAAGERARLRFTPTTSGTYTIESSGTSDTYVYLLDAAGEEIASDDDSGNDRNFRLSHALEAGSTYYYEVRYYSTSATGTIPVSISDEVPTDTTYRALLVGEVDFDTEDANRNRGDVNLMSNMLRNVTGPDGGRYQVTTRIDRSPAQIRDDISSTFYGADSDDVSLFFIATHGDASSTGRIAGALSTGRNTSTTTAYRDAVLFEELASWLGDVPGKVIVVVQSCGSGAGIWAEGAVQNSVDAGLDAFNQELIGAFASTDKSVITVSPNSGELRRDGKFYVLTASRYLETSWGTEYPSSYNFFTKWLTDGVGTSGGLLCDGSYTSYSGWSRSGNGNGVVELEELFDYISAVGDDYPFDTNYHQHVQRYPVSSSYQLFKR